jgi:hypothetical protein
MTKLELEVTLPGIEGYGTNQNSLTWKLKKWTEMKVIH